MIYAIRNNSSFIKIIPGFVKTRVFYFNQIALAYFHDGITPLNPMSTTRSDGVTPSP